MEDKVGFEPTDAFTPTVFKTVAIDRSTTCPMAVQIRFELMDALTRRQFSKLLV